MKMKITCALVGFALASFALGHSAVARELAGNLQSGMTYPEARQTLLNRGWRPANVAEGRCVGRPEVCATYPETDDCAGTGLGQCKFLFTDGKGSVLAVVTVGEDPLLVDNSHIEREVTPSEIVQITHGGAVDLSKFTCIPTSGESSLIKRVCFQDTRLSTQPLLLQLKSKWYQHCNVDQPTLAGLLAAPSLGKFYNARIRGNFACLSN
ncbi:KTSC domain-containing protein [Mesorhizobium sp. M1A.T.Ca.IN.004.03.1.1]|nr:KTSC domain-containing protein [Mesorhizobium sp. M1A.T.Ca.IN.004.03.1.1]